jgi:hypothetical protein
MGQDDPLRADALAVLAVHLASRATAAESRRWHRWHESFGEPCGFEEDRSFAHESPPFKKLPNEWPYFNAHVEQLLFPRGEGEGERWVCCPEDLTLVARPPGGPPYVTRIDLLERLTVPGRQDCAFGLLHLSLEPGDEEPGADDLLWWARAIRSAFRNKRWRPQLELHEAGTVTPLEGGTPVRELVQSTLGEPHRDLERRLFGALMLPCPADLGDSESEAQWRRTMAAKLPKMRPEDAMAADRYRERERAFGFGKTTALVRGDGAVLTQAESLTKADARNFRSYWAESLLVGLVQHDCLEHFQSRLARLGSPVKPDIEPLYRSWLDFRNLIWWSQLAIATDVPQDLLFALRSARGTERLFTDLEGDLATYSAQRRSVVEDKQAAALRNLQVGGAAIVVLGPLLAIVAMTGESGGTLAALIIASIAAALVFATLAHMLLKPREA